jgi:hypothetical protein
MKFQIVIEVEYSDTFVQHEFDTVHAILMRNISRALYRPYELSTSIIALSGYDYLDELVVQCDHEVYYVEEEVQKIIH